MQVFSMSGDIVDSELQKAGFEVDVRVVKKSDEGVVVHRIHDLTDKSKVILHVVPIEKQNKRAKPEDVVVTRLELMENWKVFVSNEVKVIGMWSFACMFDFFDFWSVQSWKRTQILCMHECAIMEAIAHIFAWVSAHGCAWVPMESIGHKWCTLMLSSAILL